MSLYSRAAHTVNPALSEDGGASKVRFDRSRRRKGLKLEKWRKKGNLHWPCARLSRDKEIDAGKLVNKKTLAMEM